MFQWLLRKAKRDACRQLAVELLRFNKKDYCWDPIGSIDHRGLERAIESIASGTIDKRTVAMAKSLFPSRKRSHDPKVDGLQAARKGNV